MSSEDQITRTEAEEIADEFVRLFSLFTPLLQPGDDPKKALRFVERLLEDPVALRGELVDAIVSGQMKYDEFIADKVALRKMAASPRRMFDEIKKQLPAGRPGRPRKNIDERQLVQLATGLVPVCQALLVLRSHPTKRTVGASIEYLSADFPEFSKFLLGRSSRVEAILANRKSFRGIRTLQGRARTLAYLLVGEEHGYHGTYALRKVRTAVDRRKRPATQNAM